MFCPKCGSILKVKDGSVFCSCGYTDKNTKQVNLSDKPKHKEVRVLDGENRLAVHDHVCEKCGHDKAELIERGIMYSDEDDVVLYKCGKCGYTKMMDAKVT